MFSIKQSTGPAQIAQSGYCPQRTSPRDTEFPRRSMAKQRSITSNLGLYVYAGAAIFLGLLGLGSGN